MAAPIGPARRVPGHPGQVAAARSQPRHDGHPPDGASTAAQGHARLRVAARCRRRGDPRERERRGEGARHGPEGAEGVDAAARRDAAERGHDHRQPRTRARAPGGRARRTATSARSIAATPASHASGSAPRSASTSSTDTYPTTARVGRVRRQRLGGERPGRSSGSRHVIARASHVRWRIARGCGLVGSDEVPRAIGGPGRSGSLAGVPRRARRHRARRDGPGGPRRDDCRARVEQRTRGLPARSGVGGHLLGRRRDAGLRGVAAGAAHAIASRASCRSCGRAGHPPSTTRAVACWGSCWCSPLPWAAARRWRAWRRSRRRTAARPPSRERGGRCLRAGVRGDDGTGGDGGAGRAHPRGRLPVAAGGARGARAARGLHLAPSAPGLARADVDPRGARGGADGGRSPRCRGGARCARARSPGGDRHALAPGGRRAGAGGRCRPPGVR